MTTTPLAERPIVVGVDASKCAVRAAAWAAAEAQQRGVALHLIHALVSLGVGPIIQGLLATAESPVAIVPVM